MPGFAFNTITDTIRTNTHHFEFDASRAVEGLTNVKPHKILVMGIGLTAGTVDELVPKRILSGDMAEGYWGVGSQIAEMARAAKVITKSIEMWGCSIDELSGGTAGTTTITVVGTATATGNVHLYIGGIYIVVAIAATDDATAIATKINAAIQAHASYSRLPFTSGSALGVVTLTMKWKGVDQAPVKINYRENEALPAGVTSITVAEGVAGAGNPDVGEIITAIGDVQYDTVLMPWGDATNLTALETELATRWGGMVQKAGHAFVGHVGTHSAVTTFGNSRNSRHLTIMAGNESPTAPWIWGAVTGAVDAAEPHPARPRQTLPMYGLLPAKPELVWSDDERNLLLYDGVATHTVDQGGNVLVERLITTYQTNALAIPDPTFLDVTTLRTLEALRYDRRAAVSLSFSRHLLMDDPVGNESLPEGLPIVTPLRMKAHGIAQFRRWASNGWVELAALEQFKDEYQVIRDPADRNRLQEQMSPDLMNQFRGISGQMQFLL